jgi:hypothetical protein
VSQRHAVRRADGYARRDHEIKTRGPRPEPWQPPAVRHVSESRLHELAIRAQLGRRTLPWR